MVQVCRNSTRYADYDYGKLAICTVRTSLSLSHDASFQGRPIGFGVVVRDG